MHPQQRMALEKSTSISDEALQNRSASNHHKVPLAKTISSEEGQFINSSTAVGATTRDACGSRLSLRGHHSSEQGQSCGGPPIAHEVPQGPQMDMNNEQQVEQRAGDVQQQHAEQLVDVQLGEPEMNCCSFFYDCFKDAVMKFRNSAFIYLLQALIVTLPVSEFGMGIAYYSECKKASYLPPFSIVLGVVGCCFMVIWVNISRTNRAGTTLSTKEKSFFVFFCVLLTFASVVNAILFYCLAPSWDPKSNDYCNETFYIYSCFKGIATILFVVFSLLLYLPGMRHTVCCEQCQFDHSGRYYAL